MTSNDNNNAATTTNIKSISSPLPSSSSPPSPPKIHKIGRNEFTTINGTSYKRRAGTDADDIWTPVEVPVAMNNTSGTLGTSSNTYNRIYVYLHLVRLHQATSPKKHWLLHLAPENAAGNTYEVTGDAEFMRYAHSRPGEDVIIAELEGVADVFEVAGFAWDPEAGVEGMGEGKGKNKSKEFEGFKEEVKERIEKVVAREKPPAAADRRSVWENCQGWVVRVVEGLVEEGLVERRRLEMVKGLLEPV